MEPIQCRSCGQVIHEWVQFCPDCAEPIEGYARPAGFWIRVGAQIVDFLVFIPIAGLGTWNIYAYKSTVLIVLLSMPGFLYKPLMEAYCGATLGKMACGIKVVDARGNRLPLFLAYARALPFLLAAGLGLASSLALFSSPQFQAARTAVEMAEVQRSTGVLGPVNQVVQLLVFVECVFAAFTFRKRALHDMLAESFVVYKES